MITDIGDTFNEYFVNIGTKLASKLGSDGLSSVLQQVRFFKVPKLIFDGTHHVHVHQYILYT